MNPKTYINWAIIGTGKITRKFAADLKNVPNANCYAVASRSLEKAQQFAQEFGFEKHYGSYEDLVNDDLVDAVYVATPHALHKANTVLCLKNKIAVLCEKPFAMNTEEVQEMIYTAKENDTLLMEALWTYFLPHYLYVLNMVKNDELGAITHVNADFGFFREFTEDDRLFNKQLGGGSLLDIGIYPIFVALTLLGKPDTIQAHATYFENGADSSCNMIFEYSNGTKALLKSTLLEDTPTAVTIECEQGSISITPRFYQPTTVTVMKNGISEKIDFHVDTIGYNYEAEHFTNLLLQHQKESPVMDFNTSLNLIGILDSVRKIINLNY